MGLSLTLFGGVNEFSALSQKYNYTTVDNGYIRLIFEFGIIGMTAYLLLVILSTRKLVISKQYIFAICIIGVAVWGLSENILIDCSYNITILFWSILLNKSAPISNRKPMINFDELNFTVYNQT